MALPENLSFILTIVGIVFGCLLTISLIIAKLYVRSTKEVAFVRTGMGGEKIAKDGGMLVLPVLHETIPVSMNTLRIEVGKIQKDALITKDRMRVDVKADFYLRVAPTKEGISMAAQTLGIRTMRVEELKKLMESKFVDVLRSVAAEMTMTEMHEKRSDFVQKVQQNVINDLEKNGLELESVSLTGFDQTDLQFFNENNAFDAEGRALLAQIIERKRKETNDIEQENRILIEQRNLLAEKQSLDIEQEKRDAELSQEQAVEMRKAEQQATIIKQREQREQEEREAEIAKQRAIESAEIEKAKYIESAEIEKAKYIETAEIEKRKVLEQSRIQQQRDIEVAMQEKQIAVAEKSEEESAARAKAAEAEKSKVEKEEAVITAREVAQANRNKQIEVIAATKEAERDAVAITVQAQAGKQAAEDNAESILIEAKASADALKLNAEANEKVYAVEAAGKRSRYEADNLLSTEQIELQKSLAILNVLPELIANAVKPLENIDGIKILQGYGGGNGNQVMSAGGANNDERLSQPQSLSEQVTSAALSYRANAPLVDSMLKEIGLVDKETGTLEDLISGNHSFAKQTVTNVPTNDAVNDPESNTEIM